MTTPSSDYVLHFGANWNAVRVAPGTRHDSKLMLRMTDHAWGRRATRAPRARLGGAVEIPHRMARRLLLKEAKDRKRQRAATYRVCATGTFLAMGQVVVTVMGTSEDLLAETLVYLMLGFAP